MRRSQRVSSQLKYDLFHTTGARVYKESVADDQSGDGSDHFNMAQVNDLQSIQISIHTLNGDLGDFLEEYAVYEMEPNIEDFDRAIFRMEEFRSVFREKHRSVLALMGNGEYDGNYGDSLEQTLGRIKQYLLEIKQARKQLRQYGNLEQENANAANERYFNFIQDDVKLQLVDLEGETSKVPEDFSDDELAIKNKNIIL